MWSYLMAFAISTANRPVALVNVDRSDAVCRKRDGKRRAAYGHCSNRNGLDNGLPRSRSGGHLIQMSCARERLTVDGGNFGGIGAIDGDEDGAAGSSGVRTGVNDDTGHVARRGLQRYITEVRGGPVESAECAEARESVGISAARRPEVGGEESHTSENAEVIGLCDGTSDVVKASVFIFGNRNFHARVFRVDFGL